MPSIMILILVVMLTIAAAPANAWIDVAPSDYGSVTIRNFSSHAGLAPVRFDHWLHRALYTCRLCHVDIGFAMEGNGTKITAASNMKGFYCGACHNGARLYKGKKIFSSCTVSATAGENMQCKRCHSAYEKAKREDDYATFTEKFPVIDRAKRFIDWEEAEARGLIHPVDYLPGISIERNALAAQKDFAITSKSEWMPNIIFSHKKHVMWNGCEVCHPDIFPSVKKGTVEYSMFDISSGRYCGVCHDRVAFSLRYCEKCHATPVR